MKKTEITFSTTHYNMLQLESSAYVRKGFMLLDETQSKFIVAMENFNKCSMKCDVITLFLIMISFAMLFYSAYFAELTEGKYFLGIFLLKYFVIFNIFLNLIFKIL